MAQQDSYSEMQDLLSAIQSVTNRLSNGQLSANEVNEACEAARQLYERWVVIRYKVFEGTPLSSDGKTKSDEALLNQTSLIDAIQEAEVSQPQLLDMFSFEIDGAPTSAETKESPIEAAEPVELEIPDTIEDSSETIEVTETLIEELPEEIEDEPEEQIIAKAKNEEAGSLAEKLEKSPISNLKSAIGLNRKFQFINTLFDGDNEKYDASIKLLNEDQSLEEASNWVKSNVPQKFEDEDDAAVLDAFVDLVERRHS